MQAVAQQLRPSFKNAAKLFTMTSRSELKLVRVLNKTASMTNGHALIRRFMSIPDGVYDVNAEGDLVKMKFDHGLNYPDIELIRPPFETMKPLCEIPNALLGRLIAFCHEVHRVEGSVVLDKGGAFMLQNSTVNVPFPFNVEHQVKLNPKYFEIALIEMLQYASVYLLQERRANEDERHPLVIGRDWGQCALLMPIR